MFGVFFSHTPKKKWYESKLVNKYVYIKKKNQKLWLFILFQAICESIKPNIDQRNVDVYLYEHIELDLTSIQNILGKNKDDVLLLMHHLLAEIMNKHTMAVIGQYLVEVGN